jgi:hypothetical protein
VSLLRPAEASRRDTNAVRDSLQQYPDMVIETANRILNDN